MAKPIPKVGSHRNGRSSARKSAPSFNNTIVIVIDVQDRVISWSSTGTFGFNVVDQGMQRAEVIIKGPGLERDAALRAIRRSGILLSFVRDVTPMPHNGCRPPKK
ncbi:hypothetical protein V6Z11_A09G282400, partial [Gossypium hirsutum]